MKFPYRIARVEDYYDDDYYGDGVQLVTPLQDAKRWVVRRWPFKHATPGLVKGTHNYTQIFDMSEAISSLEPDSSAFTTMLMSLGPRKYAAPQQDSRLWSDYEFEGWGGPSPEARAALVHFLPQVEYTPQLKVEWLEDELFPRTGRVVSSEDPHFYPGATVRMV